MIPTANRDAQPVALRTVALSHRYGQTKALIELDLDVAAGEIHALLGPNGSGKTTVTRVLATLLAPTSGRVSVLGFDAIAQPVEVRRRIGVVLQDVGLDPLATGIEVLRLQARLRGLDRIGTERRARELLTLVGLQDVGEKMTATYSGGMRRRLDLACALVHAPAVLLLDEPTTGLDPLSRGELWRELTRLREQGCAIVLTTQYLEEADRLANRVSILRQGQLIARGAPKELKAALGTNSVLVTLRPADQAAAMTALASLPALSELSTRPDGLSARVSDGASVTPLISACLRDAGIVPLAISVTTATLDDVFERALSSDIGSTAERDTIARAGYG